MTKYKSLVGSSDGLFNDKIFENKDGNYAIENLETWYVKKSFLVFLYYEWTTLKQLFYKKNRFNRHLVDMSTDEKRKVIYKAPNRVTDFEEITKPLTMIFLNVSIAREDEQVCCILFETTKTEHLFFKKKTIFLQYYRNRWQTC